MYVPLHFIKTGLPLPNGTNNRTGSPWRSDETTAQGGSQWRNQSPVPGRGNKLWVCVNGGNSQHEEKGNNL
jgi:hypothetical protein